MERGKERGLKERREGERKREKGKGREEREKGKEREVETKHYHFTHALIHRKERHLSQSESLEFYIESLFAVC